LFSTLYHAPNAAIGELSRRILTTQRDAAAYLYELVYYPATPHYDG